MPGTLTTLNSGAPGVGDPHGAVESGSARACSHIKSLAIFSINRTTSSISPLSWLDETIPRVESYCFMSPSEVFKWEWRTSEVQYTKCAWWRLCVPFWSCQAKGWRKPMKTETTGRLELCMAAKQTMLRNRTWQFYTRKPQ